MHARLTTILALAAALAALVAIPAANAKDGDVRVRGTCTKAATSKLKLSSENGGIEVELEVDQNRNGVPWRVVLRRNGAVVASGTARTRGPSGSFSFRRVIAGTAGSDRVVAVARSASGGTCTATATI